MHTHIHIYAQGKSLFWGFQKTSLCSTLRRLGEDIFRSKCGQTVDIDKVHTPPAKGDKPRDGIFFRSSNLHVRFLSSLIILKTLSQGKYY